MKLVPAPGKRVVFSGPIAGGIGDYDYLCGSCGIQVLSSVSERRRCRAVFECAACHALNLIEPPDRRPLRHPRYRWWRSAT
jgi:hypothetical protein